MSARIAFGDLVQSACVDGYAFVDEGGQLVDHVAPPEFAASDLAEVVSRVATIWEACDRRREGSEALFLRFTGRHLFVQRVARGSLLIFAREGVALETLRISARLAAQQYLTLEGIAPERAPEPPKADPPKKKPLLRIWE
ncbi:MAG: hypothetical protein ACREM2_11340 [Vulcanimicrobiaceae bacterium]